MEKDNLLEDIVDILLKKDDRYVNALWDFVYIMEKFTSAYRVRDIMDDNKLTKDEQYEKIKRLVYAVTEHNTNDEYDDYDV